MYLCVVVAGACLVLMRRPCVISAGAWLLRFGIGVSVIRALVPDSRALAGLCVHPERSRGGSGV